MTKVIYGMATVTIHGILAGGLYYTCEYAILNKWFQNSNLKDEWSVPIVMYPECYDFIFVFIEKQNTYVLARLVALPMTTNESKEQYYRKLQSIKEKLINRKRK
jgi:hypothetical protein